MRKGAILWALLLVLSVGGVCLAAAGVYKVHDQVVLTETIVYGDRAAADGLSVQLYTRYDSRLFWDTTCTLDTEQRTQTAYSFSASRTYENRPTTYSGVSLQANPEAGAVFDPESPEPPAGLGRVYWELYHASVPGEEKSTVVYLKDYMDCYPIYVELDFPGTQSSSEWWEVPDPSEPEPGTERYTMAKIQDYFQIPVLEDERISISVGRHESGNGWSSGSGTEGDSFSMRTYSALAGDACYFTFDAHSSDGQVVDTSGIPGGYGLYRLPYEEERHDESGQKVCGVDADGLEMVYPLDPEIQLLSLRTDPEQTKLLLYTWEEGAYILTVIGLETRETLQRLEIADCPEYSGWSLWDEDDFMVIQLGEKLAVVAPADSGGYALRFICDVRSDELPDFWFRDVAWDFDGERLAFVCTLEKQDNGWGWVRGTCGFRLGVYEASGLVYCGEYSSSLDTGVGENSNYYCRGRDYDPLSVCWLE